MNEKDDLIFKIGNAAVLYFKVHKNIQKEESLHKHYPNNDLREKSVDAWKDLKFLIDKESKHA